MKRGVFFGAIGVALVLAAVAFGDPAGTPRSRSSQSTSSVSAADVITPSTDISPRTVTTSFVDAGIVSTPGGLVLSSATASNDTITSYASAATVTSAAPAVLVTTPVVLDSTDMVFGVVSTGGVTGFNYSGKLTLVNDIVGAAGVDVTSIRSYYSIAGSGVTAFAPSTEGARVYIGPDTYFTESGVRILMNGGNFETVTGTITSGDNLITSAGADLQLGRDVYMSSGGTLRRTDADAAVTLTGGCTSPTVTWSNGSALFQVDVGTSCAGISTIVLTFPAATDGWECKCTNTSAAATRVIDSSAWSTTTVTVTNYSRTLGTAADFADGADIRCMCRGG